MSQNNWGLSSSSSESDDDDDRPVSKLRTDTVFYQQFLNGACHDEWPDQIAQRQLHQQQQQQHSFNHVHENQSMHSFGNISMKGESSRMSTSIISSSILNKTPDNFVFVDHGDRLQPVRVVNANEIPELNASIPFTPIPPPSIPIAPIPGPSGSVPSALLPPSVSPINLKPFSKSRRRNNNNLSEFNIFVIFLFFVEPQCKARGCKARGNDTKWGVRTKYSNDTDHTR